MPWIFVEELADDVVTIRDSEAHHLLHVLRAECGNELTLFDGRGTAATAVVTAMDRRTVRCTVQQFIPEVSAANPLLSVAVSPPKGDRLRWLVEKLTEIGVDSLLLMQTQRTIVNPREAKLDKLRQTVIAACKQSQRPRLMQIEPVRSVAEIISASAGSASQLVIAHPSVSASRPADVSAGQRTCLMIGPEGGFTDAEVEQAINAGAMPAQWSPGILRTETAAIVFATILLENLQTARE